MNKNPLNKDEKERQKFEPARVEPDLETDKFSASEQKKIVQMVMEDARLGLESMKEWKEQKRRDILHLSGAKPSVIENLNKKAWMADINLNLCAATCDIYQAVLLATCYNPDSIHFRDTEKNDVDNKDNLEKFAKWVLGDSEAKFFPEVDDFIHNRVGLGFSLFKIQWEVKYVWVDRRIPIPSKDGSRRIIGYDIKTEERRFERGVIRNVDELDDILIPEYGKDVHELPFFIEILHLRLSDLEEMSKRKQIVNFDEDKKKALRAAVHKAASGDKLKNVEAAKLGGSTNTSSADDAAERNLPVDVYEAYETFTKNGMTEMYRFWVEPTTETFFGGKPLRKIMRDGKIPYEGGPLRRRPGRLRGGSLPSLIEGPINALNNNYNSTSDFQYVQNCPYGYYDKNQEGLESTMQEIEPGKLNPVDGNPNELVFFPNLTRSLAWSYEDKKFLLEMVERLTGAASYFMTSNTPDTTATRDTIVEEKGTTKFGLWVKRIQTDISRAVNRLIGLYQDWAPPDLATRVLGEDGKAIIKNLSINSLRGNYDAYMVPDITNGSKAYERQVAMWGFDILQKGSVWFDPQLNPRGNWLLTKDAMKKQGYPNPEHYLPPQPKDKMDYSKEAEEHFNQLKQGDRPEPPGPDNPMVVECFATFMRLKETKIHELDEEYRANFEDYYFKVMFNYRRFIQNLQREQMANQIAMRAAESLERLRPPAPVAPKPVGPVVPAGPVPGAPGPRGGRFEPGE